MQIIALTVTYLWLINNGLLIIEPKQGLFFATSSALDSTVL